MNHLNCFRHVGVLRIVGSFITESDVRPDSKLMQLCCCCSHSTLALTRISSEDEAIYQCIAENSAGTNQASARLAVTQAKDLPAAPQGLTASPVSTSTLQITWSSPSTSTTDIIGYVLHIRKLGGGHEHTLTHIDYRVY